MTERRYQSVTLGRGVVPHPGDTYHGRVTRITTPLDNLMNDVAVLVNEFWLVLLLVLVVAVGVATAFVVARSRERAKYREPQYRRHSYMD